MNETFNVISYVVSCLTFNLNFVYCIKLVSPKCLDTWFVATFILGGGACRPPAGRAGCLPPLHRTAGACRPAGGRQAPARGLRAKKFIFIYM